MAAELIMNAQSHPNYICANVKKIKDLPRKWVEELEVFFVNYHNLEGKEYRLLGCKGANIALRLINDARRAR